MQIITNPRGEHNQKVGKPSFMTDVDCEKDQAQLETPQMTVACNLVIHQIYPILICRRSNAFPSSGPWCPVSRSRGPGEMGRPIWIESLGIHDQVLRGRPG